MLKKSVVLFFILLSGCASHLNQTQCMNMNWGDQGFSDGARGLPMRDLNKDIKDCSRFNISVDTAAYRKAWRQGTRRYCKPATAYRLGVEGRAYPSICPEDLQDAFDKSWRRGLRKFCIPANGYRLGRDGKPMPQFCPLDKLNAFRAAYDNGYRKYQRIQSLQRQRDTKRSDMHKAKNQIKDIQDKMADINRQLTNPNTSPEQYQQLRYKLYTLEKDIEFQRVQLDRWSQQLSNLNQQIAYFEGE